MLWEVDVYPASGQPDLAAARIAADAADLQLADGLQITVARGFLLEGKLQRDQVVRFAGELLADQVVERFEVGRPGDLEMTRAPVSGQLVHVLPKPGVMDPVAQSTLTAIADLGFKIDAVR